MLTQNRGNLPHSAIESRLNDMEKAWGVAITPKIRQRISFINVFFKLTMSLFNNKCYRQGGQSSSRFLLVMRDLWGSIMTEEQVKICRRMAVPKYLFESVNITLYSFEDSYRAY